VAGCPGISVRRSWLDGVAGGGMNGLADSGVGATAAKVSVHRPVDILVGGVGIGGEEGGGTHDLPGLAVPALGNIEVAPGLLEFCELIALGKAFDGHDLCVADGGDGEDAGADGLSVEVNGAGPALGHAAAELRAMQAEGVAQGPEERGI